ncbi:MAG: rRNA pseudouridine synthase [Defluviitaleaceae bacterium]|nr:rRNA pseudouridine synthase [Defluviitaleaceae bacterium]MCL2264138.1 rRNA pseudouridine synthase [Defluviitaleaceae bacterium]
MGEVRLQKILSAVVSRRRAEALISGGRVTVNGTVATLGDKANPSRDIILLDGNPIAQNEANLYIMLHKPERVVTTAHDPQRRPTVFDLLPKDTRLFSVGRLDYDTSGLLLLTTDGDFAHRLTHPSHEVKKTYIARVKGIPGDEVLEKFRTGLLIEGRQTAPCEIEIIKKAPSQHGETRVRITIHEGRNRQVRKMCDAIGHPAVTLKRVEIGGVQLGDLKKGQWRALTGEELHYLHGIRAK